MPAPSPTMKYCPDCNAPNPQSRTECFACKKPLAVTETPLSPTPPSPTPASAPAATTGAVKRAPAPPGWEAEPLPNGMVRLRRTGGGRFLRDATLPTCLIFAALLVGGFTVNMAVSGQHIAAVLFGGIAVLLLGGAVATIFWGFASHEELLAGPGQLTRRQYLGSYERRWDVEGKHAKLLVTSHKSGSDLSRHGTSMTRALHAEYGAQSHLIDKRTADHKQYGLQFRTMSGVLADGMGGNGRDEILLMAHYLASETGWPVWDDELAPPARS